MTGLDTNVLARYFIEDAADGQALRQREAARRLLESGEPLFLPKTVMLELEWVMRGHYGFKPLQCRKVFHLLLAMPQIRVEDRRTVELAVERHELGLDFADALHHAACRECASMASFDDRGFARRVEASELGPRVVAPA